MKLWLAMFAFALAATAGWAQSYRVLYNFGSHQSDPANPSGVLAQGRDGSLYSTSVASDGSGDTYVYKVTPSGTLTTLLRVPLHGGVDYQSGGLTLGTDGNFYGVLPNGGTNSRGAVVKISAGGRLATLYSFTDGTDGGFPSAPPILGIDGDFYGTASVGGRTLCNAGLGCGSLYKITPSGTLTTVHDFDGTDGSLLVYAPLFQGSDGSFYGTANSGGTLYGEGTIFKISPSGNFNLLYDFGLEDGLFGAQPISGVIQGSDGNLYGTTWMGGFNNVGEVFKITPYGTLAVLHAFNQNVDGVGGYAGLVLATDGYLYGTTQGDGSVLNGCGNIYRITPSGSFAMLYSLPDDGSQGCHPETTLLQHTDGLLYGTTIAGGTSNQGVFFSFDIGTARFVTFLPAARQVGHTVEILGQGLAGTSAVSFNGTPATTFNVYANTYMTAAVPNGATSGFIQVTTPSGTFTSNKQFQVKPQVTSFSPTRGPVGTSVVITGVSLSQTSKITFNSVVATSFTVSSDLQVTVTVPDGASSSKIGVTTTGAPVYSPGLFNVTQ